jgi:hypothetical protein
MADFAEKCCDASGGRVELRIDGKIWSTRGGITLRPLIVERDVVANDDGSISITSKPVPAEIEFTIADKCGLRLEDLLNCHMDITASFLDMREVWLLTQASLVGRPEISSESGEITGVKAVARTARRVSV